MWQKSFRIPTEKIVEILRLIEVDHVFLVAHGLKNYG